MSNWITSILCWVVGIVAALNCSDFSGIYDGVGGGVDGGVITQSGCNMTYVHKSITRSGSLSGSQIKLKMRRGTRSGTINGDVIQWDRGWMWERRPAFAASGWIVEYTDAYCNGGSLWHELASTILLTNIECGEKCDRNPLCNFYLWRYDDKAHADTRYTCAGFSSCLSTHQFSDGDGGHIYKRAPTESPTKSPITAPTESPTKSPITVSVTYSFLGNGLCVVSCTTSSDGECVSKGYSRKDTTPVMCHTHCDLNSYCIGYTLLSDDGGTCFIHTTDDAIIPSGWVTLGESVHFNDSVDFNVGIDKSSGNDGSCWKRNDCSDFSGIYADPANPAKPAEAYDNWGVITQFGCTMTYADSFGVVPGSLSGSEITGYGYSGTINGDVITWSTGVTWERLSVTYSFLGNGLCVVSCTTSSDGECESKGYSRKDTTPVMCRTHCDLNSYCIGYTLFSDDGGTCFIHTTDDAIIPSGWATLGDSVDFNVGIDKSSGNSGSCWKKKDKPCTVGQFFKTTSGTGSGVGACEACAAGKTLAAGDLVNTTTGKDTVCIDALPSASCSASSEHSRNFHCEEAFDSKPGSDWASAQEGVGSWIQSQFSVDGAEYSVTLFEYRHRSNNHVNSRNENITLSFSNSSSQTFRLQNKHGIYQLFALSPVNTSFVRLTVDSVYGPPIITNNGASHIAFYGRRVEPCYVNQRVHVKTCVSCSNGKGNNAGDDPTGPDTFCIADG